jgi:hypothetical protein
MDANRILIGVAVAAAVGAAVLSGPAFSGATPAAEADAGELGSGSADVEVVSTPEAVRLTAPEGPTAGHDLWVPPATVRVDGVERYPALVYKLRIPALGYARSTTLFLDADSEGRRRLAIDGGTVSGELDRERYEGELLVAVRSGADQRTLTRANVTVVVE